MEKYYEEFKEILDEQIKKIAKKGDITPQELENVYKASAIVLDMETQKAMKKVEEQQKKQEEGGQSQENRYSRRNSYGSYDRGGSNEGGQSNRSYEGGQSNHYPWFMYGEGGMSRRGGNSYGPIWNQEEDMMREQEMMEEMSNARGGRGGNSREMSREMSRERGNSRERYSREGNSNASYDNAYEGAYDGAYDGVYDGSGENSNRRGRSRRTGRYVSRDGGYSRAMDKERMIGKLEDMMDDAPSEKERKVLEQCVERLERQ